MTDSIYSASTVLSAIGTSKDNSSGDSGGLLGGVASAVKKKGFLFVTSFEPFFCDLSASIALLTNHTLRNSINDVFQGDAECALAVDTALSLDCFSVLSPRNAGVACAMLPLFATIALEAFLSLSNWQSTLYTIILIHLDLSLDSCDPAINCTPFIRQPGSKFSETRLTD